MPLPPRYFPGAGSAKAGLPSAPAPTVQQDEKRHGYKSLRSALPYVSIPPPSACGPLGGVLHLGAVRPHPKADRLKGELRLDLREVGGDTALERLLHGHPQG